MTQVYQLAALYLRSDIRTWETVEQRAAKLPENPHSRMNLWCARRSKACCERMLRDLEDGNILDDREGRRARDPGI